MPRVLTTDQRALLHSDAVKARALVTFHMDDGVHRFCDDVQNCSDGTNTYIGASALASVTDIRSPAGLASEQVTITVDGTRITQSGFTDPAAFFRSILALKLVNRRVDIAYGFSNMNTEPLLIPLVIPVFAGRINTAKVTAQSMDFASFEESGQPLPQKLEIVVDSLAARYTWVTGRTRSHADHQEFYPGDNFFKYVNDAKQVETTLYWGKAAPSIRSPT